MVGTGGQEAKKFPIVLKPALQGLGAPPGEGIQRFGSECDFLDFVSFFDWILLDFRRFPSITVRIVSQKAHRASHTKRTRRCERLQWFSALKTKKNRRFCSKTGFCSVLADISDFLCTGLISSHPMSIRGDDIGNLSKNLHNTPLAPPKPKGSNWGRCPNLQTCPPTLRISRFSVTGHSRNHT